MYITKGETKQGNGRTGRVFQNNCTKTHIEQKVKQDSSFAKARKKRKKKR